MTARALISYFLISASLLLSLGCGSGTNDPFTPTSQSAVEIVVADQYSTFRDVALFVSSEDGVLSNDAVSDGDISFTARSTSGGSVRGYAQGAFFYTPPANFVGADSFTYTVSDGDTQATGLVEVQVRQGSSGLSIDLYQGSWQFLLVAPTDPREFASYLQAQIAGGALQGSTTIRQSDGIPFTRFSQISEADLFHAALARDYAVQLAAEALGFEALEEAGMHQALVEYEQMNPEAKLFLQVAAVFKGNLLDGPGNYDNPGLRDLLISKGLDRFVTSSPVGVTDVETLGAIGAAMNAGQLTIADILNSGTFEDIERYDLVVEYVYGGEFRELVQRYESAPL